MFAKILSSSQTFNGVDYNERKVSQGVAQLIEIKNFSSQILKENIPKLKL